MSATSLLAAARRRLVDAPTEALGESVQPRRILGIARASRIVPAGSAWHLGVLLLTDDTIAAVGEVIRSKEGVPRGYTAESQRRRGELAAAAFRGGFAEGATVHVGWQVLDPEAVDGGAASGPLRLVDGVPSVRWSASGGYAPLERYLEERISLLVDPPPRA